MVPNSFWPHPPGTCANLFKGTCMHITCPPTHSDTMHLCMMQQNCCGHTRIYIIALLSLCHLPDPIAFCDIVGKEEDAEKEEDMKNSKQNEEEARAVVSTQPTYSVLLICVLMID